METNEEVISRIASVETVNLNSEAVTNLYVVPTGKVFVPHSVIIRDLSADAASAVVTLGQTGDADDFLGAQTLSNLSAAGLAGILQPIPAATTAAIVEYTAGEIFCLEVTTAAGSGCTATVDVFGYLRDA